MSRLNPAVYGKYHFSIYCTSFPGNFSAAFALLFSRFAQSDLCISATYIVQRIANIMSRQRKKKEDEEEVQVVDEAPQVEEEMQVAEEEGPIGPHPVSMLQVRTPTCNDTVHSVLSDMASHRD